MSEEAESDRGNLARALSQPATRAELVLVVQSTLNALSSHSVALAILTTDDHEAKIEKVKSAVLAQQELVDLLKRFVADWSSNNANE